MMHYADEGQKTRKPRLCSGEWVCAIAMTEPQAWSDLQRICTAARLDGDEYVVNGQDKFMSSGQSADLIILAVKTTKLVVDACIQLFGSYGHMTEYPIARMHKDVRIRRIPGGSSEIMKMTIARTL